MKSKKVVAKQKEDPTRMVRFNEALNKMSDTAIQYRDGAISHRDFVPRIDAIVSASGWGLEEFYKEIDARKLYIK